MQTAHDTIRGAGLVVLNKMRFYTGFAVTLLVVRLYEISTRIAENLGLQNQ